MHSRPFLVPPRSLWIAACWLVVTTACQNAGDGQAGRDAASDEQGQEDGTGAGESSATRNAYFGDLHLHTALSVDAYITNTRTLPDDAYRYAKGEPIDHLSGTKIRLNTPLDFLAVTDHAEFLGGARAMADPNHPLSKSPLAPDMTSSDYARSQGAFRQIVAGAATGNRTTFFDPADAAEAVTSAWREVIEAAERHNAPGEFTTFVAYEWSSMPGFRNLHRNVIFAGTRAPVVPFSSANSNRPEDLWQHLDDFRADHPDTDVLAIPHNSNASSGLMFPLTDSDGNAITRPWAEQRMRNEPLVEISQAKGTSETHPVLSPEDEWAGHELWETVVGGTQAVDPVPGSYMRSAYLRGLELEQQVGANPYQFGIVAASDNHDSSSAVEEDNFTGGHGNADSTAKIRLNSQASTLTTSSLKFSASGLTGVWAESNTRESIFAALRRRETFGTSGPRIRVRLFAGDNLPADLFDQSNAVERAYATAVPMGGDLLGARAPRFGAWAQADPNSAPLQRLQVVKGWIGKDGVSREVVVDVACAIGEPTAGRCPLNDAGVDLSSCARQGDGAADLSVVWTDPDFQSGQRAFYYLRAIENPSCRWSTWDAIQLGVEPPAGVPATLQERAWSSPIWLR